MRPAPARLRNVAFCVLVTLALAASHAVAFTFDQIEYWVGEGPNRAALVIDWSDAQPPLAWGYRFRESATSETMLRAIVGADRRLYARLGSNGPFGVPLYGIGYDRNLAGFALSDGTQFVDGIAVTGPSDGALALDPRDSYVEGWFDGFWALFVADDGPYSTGQWEMGSSGISGRMLADGDWDGLSFAAAEPTVPRLPTAAVRHAARLNTAYRGPIDNPQVVPEPGHQQWLLVLALMLGVVASRATRGRTAAVCLGVCLFLGVSNCHAGRFAAMVVQYTPGTDVPAGFDDPAAALGPPTRDTAPESPYGGPVTPFNAPFDPQELVSIGFGGSLTLGFDGPIEDRNLPAEFGVDFIVFGNSFFFDGDFPNGVVAGIGTEPGLVEVSQDGSRWYAVEPMADTAFPTMGYQDVTAAFPTKPGNVPTDFSRPVDPSLDPNGFNMPQLIDAYAGAGGGTGVDISATGLPWIQYVRITNQNDPTSMITPEVDSISVVPEPAGWMWSAFFLICAGAGRRRRQSVGNN